MLTENKIASIETLLSAIDEWWSCETSVQINREKAEEFYQGEGDDDDDYNFNTIEEFEDSIKELEEEAGLLLEDISVARSGFYREWSEPGMLALTPEGPVVYVGEGKFLVGGELCNTDSGHLPSDLDALLHLARWVK